MDTADSKPEHELKEEYQGHPFEALCRRPNQFSSLTS